VEGNRSPIGRPAIAERSNRSGLLDLPILKRLRPRLDAFDVGVDAVSARRVVGFLRRGFLAARQLLVAALLPLPLALSLLL